MSVEGAIATHSKIALDEIKDVLGDKWDGLSEEQKTAATRAATRIVELEWKAKTTGEDVSEDLEFVKTTVSQFKLAGEIALYDAFWKGMTKALEALGHFLVGAGKSLIPGLGSLFGGIDLGALIDES